MPPVPGQFNRVNTAGTNQAGLGDVLGFGALAFFLFGIFSSAIDLIGFLRPVRPALMAAVVGLLAMAFSGRAGQVFKHKVCLMFIALTLWDIICVPFAVWPGGSAHTIIGEWLVTVLTVFLAAGLISNTAQFRKISHVIAYSAIVLSIISLKAGQLSVEGRLYMPGTRYANPNDLAVILLTAVPFLAFMALRSGNGIRRPLALCGAVPILVVVARTGSRGALIGAAVAVGVLFLQVSVAQKLKLLLGGVVTIGVLLTAMPSQLTERFLTIFGGSDTVYDIQKDKDSVLQSAIESSYSRRMLLMDSLTLTYQHPIFGVGLGNFPVAQDNLARARGEMIGNWHVTHNTYTQVSSESGLPGLVLFLFAIFFSFRAISHTIRLGRAANSPEGNEVQMLAVCLRIAVLAFMVCAFFASMAYLPILTVLCGLTIALELCARGLAPATIPPPFVVRPMPSFQAIKRPLRPIPQQLPRRV